MKENSFMIKTEHNFITIKWHRLVNTLKSRYFTTPTSRNRWKVVFAWKWPNYRKFCHFYSWHKSTPSGGWRKSLLTTWSRQSWQSLLMSDSWISHGPILVVGRQKWRRNKTLETFLLYYLIKCIYSHVESLYLRLSWIFLAALCGTAKVRSCPALPGGQQVSSSILSIEYQ